MAESKTTFLTKAVMLANGHGNNGRAPGVAVSHESRGPRCITIQRAQSGGFGFTLRHFIVYPPESLTDPDCPKEWQQTAGLVEPLHPLDTKFVKHVKEAGPAWRAGLATGDQIVSVNGESVLGKSYAQVVQMIQRSGPTLQLTVVPQEHDVIQQCFAETAHNPQSNLNVKPTVVATPPLGMKPDKNASLSHLPRPKPYQPFNEQPSNPRLPAPVRAPGTPTIPVAAPSAPAVVAATATAAAAVPSVIPIPANVTGTTPTPTQLAAATLVNTLKRAELMANGVQNTSPVYGNQARSRASLSDYPTTTTASTMPHTPVSKRSSYAGHAAVHIGVNSGKPPSVAGGQHESTLSNSSPSLSASVTTVGGEIVGTGLTQPVERTSSGDLRGEDSLNSSKTSALSESLPGGEQRSPHTPHEMVISRIKKSLEQKEEFLKRPAMPYWAAEPPHPFPKEFYGQPQKFQKPLWPPHQAAPASTSNEPVKAAKEEALLKPLEAGVISTVTPKETNVEDRPISTSITSIEPWSLVFSATSKATPPSSPSTSPYAGLVPNSVPKPFYGSTSATAANTVPTSATAAASASQTKTFVSSLTRIQENVPTPLQGTDSKLPIPTVKTRAPLASPEEWTTSPTKTSDVVGLSREVKESYSDYHSSGSGAAARSASSGNRTIMIGNPNQLHCEPPPGYKDEHVLVDSGNSGDPRRKSVARQHSYRSAVKALPGSACSLPNADGAEPAGKTRTPRRPSHLVLDSPLNLTMSPAAEPLEADEAPASISPPFEISKPGSITADFEMSVLEQFDQLLASYSTHTASSLNNSSTASLMPNAAAAALLGMINAADNSSPNQRPSPAPRREKLLTAEEESERATRRSSYLKATARDRLATDSDADVSDVESQDPNKATRKRRLRSPGGAGTGTLKAPVSYGGTIGQLRHFFEFISLSHGQSASAPDLRLGRAIEADPVVTRFAALAQDGQLPRPRSGHISHSIQKLRELFGDKVPPQGTPKASGTTGPAPLAHSTPTNTSHEGNDVKDGAVPSPLPRLSDASVLREGFLHIKGTQVDGKRATDRSWRQQWARLKGHALILFRDKKDAHLASGGNEEMTIDVKACLVDVAFDYTKRKHVLRLTTSSNYEYLLQCEDHNDLALWLQAFQEKAGDKEESSTATPSYSSSEAVLRKQALEAWESNMGVHASNKSKSKLSSIYRNRSPTGHSPVSKSRKASLGGAGVASAGADGPPPPSPSKTKTWKGKVARQFKKMGGHALHSPSSPQQGPDGATFGVPIEFCPKSSTYPGVPLLVELCIKLVEARGLEVVGLYRVPGNNAAISALTEIIDRGLSASDMQDPRWNDVNVISSLLKSFFRKLPECLVTLDLYNSFIQSSKIEDDLQRREAIRRLVDDLPECNYYTLRFLIRHLARVAKKSHINKMEHKNLAIVFGPTLVRTTDDNMVAMVNDMSHQCRIVETLVNHADWFFPRDSSEGSLESLSKCPVTPMGSSQDVTEGSSPVAGLKTHIQAREIVSSILAAASRKRTSQTDLTDSGAAEPPIQFAPRVPPIERRSSTSSAQELPLSSQSMGPTLAGSTHSLVELGSHGGPASLPTLSAQATPPPSSSLARQTIAASEADFRNRTSSGTMLTKAVSIEVSSGSSTISGGTISTVRARPALVMPLEELGLKSYAHLSEDTKERIRKFEMETRALLQRDLAKHRKDGEARRIERMRLESAWQRAKLELETEDFLDALADNPAGVVAQRISDFVQKIRHMEANDLSVPSPTPSVDNVSTSSDSVPTADSPAPAVLAEAENAPTKRPEEENQEEDEKDQVDIGKDEEGGAIVSETETVTSQVEEPALTVPVPVPALAVLKSPVTHSRSNIPKWSKPISPVAKPPPNRYNSQQTPLSSRAASRVPIKTQASSANLKASELSKKEEAERSTSKVGGGVARSTLTPPRTQVVRRDSLRASHSSQTSLVRRNSKSRPREETPVKVPAESGGDAKVSDSTKTGAPGGKKGGELTHGAADSPPMKPAYHARCTKPEDVTNKDKFNARRAVFEPKAKLKRSDSLSKEEKTEVNTKAKENRATDTNKLIEGRESRKLRRNTRDAIKRRHTVGGTCDFDKMRWQIMYCDSQTSQATQNTPTSAWQQLQPLVNDQHLNVDRSLKTWLRKERLRTSSPDLCRRSDPICRVVLEEPEAALPHSSVLPLLTSS